MEAFPVPQASPFGPEDSGESIGAWIDAAPVCEDTLTVIRALLEEQADVYAGRRTDDVVRIRGYAMAGFAKVGMPAEAIPFALEELESGQHAYLTAAACRALRSLECPPSRLGTYLIQAYRNLRGMDDYVSFSKYGAFPGGEPATTGIGEILETFAWLGPLDVDAITVLDELLNDERMGLSDGEKHRLRECRKRMGRPAVFSPPSCCCGTTVPFGSFRRSSAGFRSKRPDGSILLEDQDARSVCLGDLFHGAPSAVVFFYTRCDNPRKCSLTISKLASLQEELEVRGISSRVRLAAFTYDPVYDTPERLRRFGADRGFRFSPCSNLLRTSGPIDELKEAFGLGVNFVGSIVNRHKLELYLLDASGRFAGSFERLQWDVHSVASELQNLLEKDDGNQKDSHLSGTDIRTFDIPDRFSQILRSISSMLPSLAIALFPKCPVCLAAWLGVLGIGSLQAASIGPWLCGILIILVVVHLVFVWCRCHAADRLLPFYLTLSGVIILFVGKTVFDLASISWVGAVLIGTGGFMASQGRACREETDGNGRKSSAQSSHGAGPDFIVAGDGRPVG